MVANPVASVPVVKESAVESPIPSAWREAFKKVVDAFALGDFKLSSAIDSVEPVSSETAAQIREYVEEYGEKLVQLPEQSWNTSVCIWIGPHWEVLIDLWTEAEGRSDLVLGARVFESELGFRIRLDLVYVP